MSDTLASILKQAEAHGILQRKVVKGGETEYLPTHPGEASTANKWSPNQPRDEMGRFGGAGGFAISPIQVTGDDANGYLTAIPKDSLPKDLMFSYSDSLNWHDGFSSENAKQESAIKAKGAKSLDSDLEKSGLAGKSKIFEDGSAIQESWADTSDNHGGAQDALQLITLRESGGAGLTETEGMKLARSKMTEDDWKAAEVTHASIKDRTQSYFKSKGLGPEDEIEVYRGLGGSSGVDLMQKAQPGDAIQIIATHPLSSWSLDPMTARQFSGTLGVVVQSRVKVKDVFSHFSSGFGCASENEVILSGTATPRVRVLSVGSPTGKSLKKMLQVNLDGEKRNSDWIQVLKRSRYQSHSKAMQAAMQAEKQHTGAMLALYPDMPPTFTLQDPDLEPTAPNELHVTMAYLGDAADLDEEDRAFLRRVCAQIASEFSPIQAKLGGIGRFLSLEDDDTQAYYASVDSPDVEALRARLVEVLGALGLLPDSDHGFTPHMTLAYIPVGKPAAGAELQEEPVEFGGLSLSLGGGEREDFPFKASGAKQNIMLTYPDESKTQRFVWQQHFRGKSSHGDFRVQSGDYLVGWTIPDQNPGAITEPVETLAQATSAVNNPDLWKMNLATGEIKPREIRSGVVRKGDLRALPKGVEIPEDWLNEQGVTDKPDPGESIPVGATRNYPGVFKIVDKGTVEHGAKKPWLAEYWIHGDKWGTQRWLFRLLERGKGDGLQAEGWEEEAEKVGAKYDPGQPRNEAGQFAGGFGASEPPHWASNEGQIVEGYTVFKGKYAAKNDYAVVTDDGQPGPFRKTPEEAVSAHEQVLDKTREFARAHAEYKGALAKVKDGDISQWRPLMGGERVTTSHAKFVLRDLGVSTKVRDKIVYGTPVVHESKFGTVYYDTEVMGERYQRLALGQSKSLKQVDTLPPGVIEAQPRSAVFWIFMQPDDQTPYVLGKEAVDKDWLPPKGVSALPKTIRSKVPPALRYWEVSGKEALDRRAKLAEMDIRELGGSSAKDFHGHEGRLGTVGGSLPRGFEGHDLGTSEGREAAAKDRLGYLIPSGSRERKFEFRDEAEDYIKNRFRELEESKGKNPKKIIVKKSHVETLPNGDSVFEHRSSGEYIFSVNRAYDVGVYVPPIEWTKKSLLDDSSAKQLDWQPYKLQRRWWRGQVVIRFGPSDQSFDLWLDQSGKPWHLVVEGNPLTNDRLPAYEESYSPTMATADGKRVSVLRIGSDPVELAPGQPANPTKDTPAFIQTVDEGEVRVIDDQPEFKKIEFKGGKLKGAWYFRLESPDSKIGEFGKSEGPAVKGEKGVRPLFGSPGGKRLLAKTIVDLIPPHKVYVEPFAGGAAVLFAKPSEMSEKEVLADADPDIAFAYRTVKGLSDAEIERLNGMEWRIGKFDEVKDSRPEGELGRLHRWLYLRKMSQGKSGEHQDSGETQRSGSGYTGSKAERLPLVRDRLASAQVRHADYKTSLKEWDGKETFFYLDPPYPESNLGAAKTELRWSDEDCADFAKALKSLKGKWLVSLQDNQTNRDLFKGYSIRTVTVPTVFNTGGGKGNDRRELLIANYPLPKRVRRKSMDDVEVLQLVYTCMGCKGEFESEVVLEEPVCPDCSAKALPWQPYLLQRHNDHHDLRIGDDFTLRLSGSLLDNEPDKAEVSTESPTLQGADGQAVDALKVKPGDPVKLADGEIQTLDKGQARYAKTQAGHQVEFKGGKLEGVYLFGPEGAHPVDLEHIDVEWEPGQPEPAPAEPEGEHPPLFPFEPPPLINPDFIHPLNPPPLIPQPALPPPGMWYMGDGEVAEGEKVGKRIKTEKLSKLQELRNSLESAVKWLGEVIGWASYQDAPEPTMLEFFKGSDAGFTVKTVQGEPWLFTWSANAFKDREGEIFSTKALENWAEAATGREDKGSFNFWHIPGTDFAVKRWVGVPGRILVEAGPFTQDEKGQAAQKFFAEFPDRHPTLAPEGWGCSVEYRYLPEERKKGVYQNVEITRTSVLPRFAAANTWTAVKEVTMALTDAQKKAAQELFGEDLAASILGEAEAKTKELEPNVAHKGDGEQTEPEPTPEVQPEAAATEEVVAEEDKAKKKPKDAAMADGEPYPKPTKAEKKQLDQFVKAIRDVAASVTDDSPGRTAILEVADKLSEENLKDMASELKKAGKAVKNAAQKARLGKLVEAMAGDGTYPAPGEGEGEGYPYPTKSKELVEEVAAELAKQFKLDLIPVGEALTATAAALKSLEDRVAELETKSGRKAATDLPRFVFGLVEQASKADATIVPEGDKLLEQKPRETVQVDSAGSIASHFFPKGK